MLKGDAAAVAGAQQEANSNAAAGGEEGQALATLADGVALCRLVQRLSRRPLAFRDASSPASALTLYRTPALAADVECGWA
jgi:hypothetical protein